MLKERVLVGLILLPIGVAAILSGDFPFYALVIFILGMAAWEYSQLFESGGIKPRGYLVVSGVVLIAATRAWNGFESAHWVLSAIILVVLIIHLLFFESGRQTAGTDFGAALAGILYIGWLGAYFISVRTLENGQWWLLIVLPVIWAADSAAYFVGSRFGRHKMSPRASPRKSWEGYLAGIPAGAAVGALLAYLWQTYFAPGSAMGPGIGAVLGFVLAALAIFGDLGESMFKRQFGVKDSGHTLPGHGGWFDRIDSWLWGTVLGYYLILIYLQLL
jgi:phosphatidate cytidylyltransferase